MGTVSNLGIQQNHDGTVWIGIEKSRNIQNNQPPGLIFNDVTILFSNHEIAHHQRSYHRGKSFRPLPNPSPTQRLHNMHYLWHPPLPQMHRRAIVISPNASVILDKLDVFARIQPESYEPYDLNSRTADRIRCRKPLGLWLLRSACLPPRRD